MRTSLSIAWESEKVQGLSSTPGSFNPELLIDAMGHVASALLLQLKPELAGPRSGLVIKVRECVKLF